MNFRHLLLGCLMMTFSAIAQNPPKEVLFTIDQKPYYTDEFVRVYNKNLDLVKDESQKDLDQYLELFVGYKLKVHLAHELGLQHGRAYQGELETYRRQLAKNYLTDSKVTQELVDEAYARTIKEIRASHILILVDENAAPADTLKAYKQVMDLRRKAMSGADFNALAKEHSQDPSAAENSGDLGYFSAFRMVYPFESAAYKTKKGEVSLPVRTRFGYHLIKVTDVRQNRGDLLTAHIMLLHPADGDAAKKQAVKDRAFEIAQKIKQGESFETMAQQFSEDKTSAAKGGVMNRFGSGQLSSEKFEDVAFSLTADKRISEPFETQFGWHIVKLIDRYPVRPAKEMQAELEARIARDERSQRIATSMTEQLLAKYPTKRNPKTIKAVKSAITNEIYQGTWTVPEDRKLFDAPLVTIKDSVYTGTMFLNYMNIQQKMGLTDAPVSKLVDNQIEKYIGEQLLDYHDANLENVYPEFAAVMDEYRDGLLLFELMEREIWQKSKTDTIGLQQFYDKNIGQYQWNERAEVRLASSTKRDAILKAQKFLRRNRTDAQIKSALNKNDEVNIMLTSGTFEKGSEALPKNLNFKVGVSDIISDGDYYFTAQIFKLLPAGPKTLEESRGRLTNDYQQHLEAGWVSELRKLFEVNVNREVFSRLKAQMKQ